MDAQVPSTAIYFALPHRENISPEDELDRRSFFPFAAGEVGEVDGNVLASDRLLAQRRDGAPCRRIVNVHVGIRARAQGVDQAVVFNEIHATVATAFRFFRQHLP